MRMLLVLAAVAQVTVIPRAPIPAKDYPIRAVPLTSVRITDGFWAPKRDVNRTVTIPHIMQQNEATGRIDNFLKAAKKKSGPYQGQRYNDTDVYKVIEAASWSLVTHPDPALDKKVDELIAIVAAAQEPGGYLYTPRSVDPANPVPGAGPERWAWLHTSHELYDQGHMSEAAVAHYSATGKVAEGREAPLDTPLTSTFKPDMLGGVHAITGKVGDRTVTAIPYYAWNNRGKGEMAVWIPY